jgi:hypothetical protein
MRKPWICAALVFLPIASAAQTVVQPLVEVPDKKGKLLADGSIRFEVQVTCVPFGDTGENNVTVTQDDQRLSAQRGIGTLDCDGKRHKYRIAAKPVEGSFHEGTAQVSAFVSQIDTSTSEARQGQATAAIEVK